MDPDESEAPARKSARENEALALSVFGLRLPLLRPAQNQQRTTGGIRMPG